MTNTYVQRTLRHLQSEVPREIARTEINFTPILISDSKGNYLKHERSDLSNPIIDKIEWYCTGGAKIGSTLNWLKRNFGRIARNHRNIVVYLWLGTCDITRKNGEGYISLIHQDNTQPEYIASKYREIADFLKSYRCKVVILETTIYSIKYWNKFKGHPNPETFHYEDKALKRQIRALNELTTEINRENETFAPKFNIDLQNSRKRRGIPENYTEWKLLKDGIHPASTTAKVWLLKLARHIIRVDQDGNAFRHS